MGILNIFDGNNLFCGTKKLNKLHLKLDHRHRMDIDEITTIDLDGYFLLNLIGKVPVAPLDISIYYDISVLVLQFDPLQMCALIRCWRTAPFAQPITQIVFNSTVTISQFHDAAEHSRLFQYGELLPVPYCRFHSIHTFNRNVVLKLACYANGNVTQWHIQTGILKSSGYRKI
ncbi:hypothetical protein WR25_10376 isoform C [Diploscapter pachys]|uniref:Uncharacterized protein n=1 Tax=Diploscapter pachys TaxID=2018661 RepID=A0A2A2JDW0_9BILA|nr:hypothetical protein WR25_10376 isoform A [Diploscapter pachys]PAV59894.1 hypothetical protein WR25_10376 isoform B [Diploscapter pachys]PAV59895.1 hypothetical protein WR25_10376 isoform C [Diploscapter pachys]